MNEVIPEFEPVRDKELAIQNFNDVADNPQVFPMRVINQLCRFSCGCKFIGDRANCTNPYCFWGIMKQRMKVINKLNKQIRYDKQQSIL